MSNGDLAAILGYDPTETFPPGRGFTNYGAHHLMVIAGNDGHMRVVSAPAVGTDGSPLTIPAAWQATATNNPRGFTFHQGKVFPDLPPGPGPAWVKADMLAHTPGWTQDPADPYAKYVVSYDANGDPVFGTPPAPPVPLDALQKLAIAAIEFAQAR